MTVGPCANQARVMLEAVQNHTPDVLVVDEIGMLEEVESAVSIQKRGIQLIATTHGKTLASVVQNPQLRGLLGGSNSVILSSIERRDEGSASKTRLERLDLPVFQCVIELLTPKEWRIHRAVKDSVDVVLRDMGEVLPVEIRRLGENYVHIEKSSFP
eukprot:NODE_4552_length_793_cov_20.559140_g4211_i0.p1 GENE.NODE_4552_length_793_cov_20.559140_g4211_i0~~NODE_4552_length_793_cov_20.559140_g4211_i0.p1  ORF type:complete len:157 (+),score=13.90 NODE_4552_length_793_cov_20.559140_g4211_i0:298-768(+)